jgi:hypothetical protein
MPFGLSVSHFNLEPKLPLPSPSDTAISRSLNPWPNFNRKTSLMRRMFNRPVGILPSFIPEGAYILSLPTRPAHHHAKSLPTFA